MSKTFPGYFYKVERILVQDPNTNCLDEETIQQLDKFFEKVGTQNKANLKEYIFWRLAYSKLAWQTANGKKPQPNGDLVEKWCFYSNLKLVG